MTENYSFAALLVGSDTGLLPHVRDALALALPSIVRRDFNPSQRPDFAPGDVAIVCEPTQKATLDALHLLRATGFTGGVALVATMEASEPDLARYAPARLVHPAKVIDELPEVVVALSDAPGDSPARRALARAQRLMAAGDVALGLQHAINNPLTALLAEAQLLELEDLPPDHRAAVERIVTQTRRVIDLVRKLDGVSERKV